MIEWTSTHFGHLVFDRDAIVRAALRAYVESCLHEIARFGFPAFDWAKWEGDLERGTLFNTDDSGDSVVAWTETGIVGLAYESGCGPIDQLGLSIDEVTGGPDDVRKAVAGLPAGLESAFMMAAGQLDTREEVYLKGEAYAVFREKLAGVGFWLYGDRIGGTLLLFQDPTTAWGAHRLAVWGMLHNGRLLPRCCEASPYPRPGKIVVNPARPQDAPAHAIIDAVVDRRLKGPTEFTPAELQTLLDSTLDPERQRAAQRMLQKVGITWPGSPEIPEIPKPKDAGA